MAENPLTKLPLAGQLGVAVAVAALIGGGFWYFYWQDAQAKEDQKRKDLAAANDEIRALEVIRNKQQEFRREVEQRKAKLDLLKRILPADKETPELMKKVQYLATQSYLQIKKFNPGPTTTKSFEPAPAPKPGQPAPAASKTPPPAQDTYQEWPINVDLEGSYHNLAMFLDKVSRLSRLVNVGGIKIKAAATQRLNNTIQVSCVATTYVYIEARPQTAGAAGAPGAPKGQPQ